MKDKLVILGAGGHGRICAETARLTGYGEIVFLDDQADKYDFVAGTISEFRKYLDDCDFFAAVGNNQIRRKLFGLIAESGGSVVSLVQPSAVIAESAVIGKGCVVMPCAVINAGAEIGDGVIVNTCSSVDHDCRIGDFCHIAVGAHLAGTVEVGENTFIGAGATVINNVSVAGNTVVGAGATVVRNLTQGGTYAGTPAKRIK